MQRSMIPNKLQPNDLVAIVSPSKTVANRKEAVEKARRHFEQATGLRTVLAPNALARHYYSAGTVQQRADDFHWAVKNPEVKAIIFSVGGSTAIELVDKLDYQLIAQNPKIIAGISDATTLLNPITAQTGLITFLGLEFLDFARQPMTYEVEAIKQAWFHGDIGSVKPNPDWRDFDSLPTSYAGWRVIRGGKAEGRIIGGNYTSFAQLYYTSYMPSVDASILAMEHYMLDKDDIQQSLAQLRLWGAFDRISSLIMGYCRGSDDPDEIGNDRDMAELVLEATEGYTFPIMQIGEIGHNVENMMLPIGARATLDTATHSFEISERVVGHRERSTSFGIIEG